MSLIPFQGIWDFNIMRRSFYSTVSHTFYMLVYFKPGSDIFFRVKILKLDCFRPQMGLKITGFVFLHQIDIPDIEGKSLKQHLGNCVWS